MLESLVYVSNIIPPGGDSALPVYFPWRRNDWNLSSTKPNPVYSVRTLFVNTCFAIHDRKEKERQAKEIR